MRHCAAAGISPKEIDNHGELELEISLTDDEGTDLVGSVWVSKEFIEFLMNKWKKEPGEWI